jgi:aminoglycoside phosphotransferase (APT) family kinase protein
MHGDFVPWNLREAPGGELWLLDWEDAGWAPPSADLLRYAVAFHSIKERRSDSIVRSVRGSLPRISSEAIAEAASFWTVHPNLQRPARIASASRRQKEDFARLHAEYESFTVLSGVR